MSLLEIHYRFEFLGGRREEVTVRFHADTFELAVSPPDDPPEWCRLEFNRCPNCSLDPTLHRYCPSALAIIEPVSHFADVISYEQMNVEVVTEERTIRQATSAQDGVSSLLGLLFATSGCPVTGFFKPMARFHLPFASEQETLYRAASMYLLGEYFRARKGAGVDTSFQGLVRIYREVEIVNRSMIKRLRTASSEDSTLNALVVLDLFAKSLPAAVEESLEELRYLFEAYLPAGG